MSGQFLATNATYIDDMSQAAFFISDGLYFPYNDDSICHSRAETWFVKGSIRSSGWKTLIV
jgi:hypothetical protein